MAATKCHKFSYVNKIVDIVVDFNKHKNYKIKIDFLENQLFIYKTFNSQQ